MKRNKTTSTVYVNDSTYIEAIYVRKQEDMHIWEFNVIDDGDVIVYVVNYATTHNDARLAVQQLLDDTGTIQCDWTKVVWHLLPY